MPLTDEFVKALGEALYAECGAHVRDADLRAVLAAVWPNTIDGLIDAILSAKQGDKEFVLQFNGDDTLDGEYSHRNWTADIGSKYSSVSVAEIGGEFSSEGLTAHETLRNLLSSISGDK